MYKSPIYTDGCCSRVMMLGKFQCRDGVLLIWLKVGLGPTVLAVGVGGVFRHLFSPLSNLFFSLSLTDGSIKTEILSKITFKSKTGRGLCYFKWPEICIWQRHCQNLPRRLQDLDLSQTETSL